MLSRYATILAAGLFAWAAAPRAAAQEEMAEPAADGGEAPSAELIIDAEEAVLEAPAMEAGEEPLPAMDITDPFPGEENIFGDDLFGGSEFFGPPSMPTIPDRPPLLEDPKELERKMRVRFRKIKARLDRDPQLLDLQDMAERAPTPEDHRAARRSYYALFFEKVRQADETLGEYADELEKSSLIGLYQTRIEPTLAMNPPPQPQPRAEFIPKQQFPDTIPFDEESVPLP
ncbi:MAG: hypothetical protein WEC73_04945 [Chthoniobacterales bacterium]